MDIARGTIEHMYTDRFKKGVRFLFQATPGVYAVDAGQSSVSGGASGDCGASDTLTKMFCNVSLPEMLNNVFQISIRLGAILAVLRIAYAGYLYMGSEDMWSTKTAAKEVFRNAIIGLLVLLGVWLILHQIDPRILNLNILQSSSSGTVPCGPNGCVQN